MTRLRSPVMKVNTPFGELRASMLDHEKVGERLLVPRLIEVDFPGGEDSGQPSLYMTIEVINGVPRCTELTLRRQEGGREIRQRDLRSIEIDEWVEGFVAKMSMEIIDEDGTGAAAVLKGDPSSIHQGMRTISGVRKGSRRPMTDATKSRVAEIYNAHESGGIEAVELAFNVSRSTAVRYIRAAREAGLIERNTK